MNRRVLPAEGSGEDKARGEEQHMPKERLVVIGGDAAGMSAASQARRRRPDLESSPLSAVLTRPTVLEESHTTSARLSTRWKRLLVEPLRSFEKNKILMCELSTKSLNWTSISAGCGYKNLKAVNPGGSRLTISLSLLELPRYAPA